MLQKKHGYFPITALTISSSPPWLLYSNSGGTLVARSIDNDNTHNYDSIISTLTVFNAHNIQGVKEKEKCIIVYGAKALSLVSHTETSNMKLSVCLENLDDLVLDCIFYDLKYSSNQSQNYNPSNIDLVIAYAHNFIDIVSCSIETSKYARLQRFTCPSKCVLFSMLLSIPIQNSDNENILRNFSGTAFGEIIVWSVSTNKRTSSNNTEFQVTTNHTFNNHEGVIFRLTLSQDQKFLASVSDDRTLRVWNIDSFTQVFVGWGHISRLWDVTFVQLHNHYNNDDITSINNINDTNNGDSNENDKELYKNQLIATSSEDGTIKIWHIENDKCLATLKGHRRDVWRVLSPSSVDITHSKNNTNLIHASELPNPNQSTNISSLLPRKVLDRYLLTTGNDGSIKTWNVFEHLIASPSTSYLTSTCLSMSFPLPGLSQFHSKEVESYNNNNTNIDDVANNIDDTNGPINAAHDSVCNDNSDDNNNNNVKASHQHNRRVSQRNNGVCSVHMHPHMPIGVIVLVTGNVWLIDFNNNNSNNTNNNNNSNNNHNTTTNSPNKKGWYFVTNICVQNSQSTSTYHSDILWSTNQVHLSRCMNILLLNDKQQKVTVSGTDKDKQQSYEQVEESPMLRLSCCHPDAYISYHVISMKLSTLSANPNISNNDNHSNNIDYSTNELFLVKHIKWKPFSLRSINSVFIAIPLPSSLNSNNNNNNNNKSMNIINNDNNNNEEGVAVCVVTSAFKGVCKLWHIDSIYNNNNNSNDKTEHYETADIQNPVKLLIEVINERENVATTCLYVPNSTTSNNNNNNKNNNNYGTLVIGDTRGGLNLYDLNITFTYNKSESMHNKAEIASEIGITDVLQYNTEELSNVLLLQSYRLATTAVRPEPISCLKFYDSSYTNSNHNNSNNYKTWFCSVGHDGYLNIYAQRAYAIINTRDSLSVPPVRQSQPQTLTESETRRIQLYRYSLVNQISCLPIKTPTHITIINHTQQQQQHSSTSIDITKNNEFQDLRFYVSGYIGILLIC